MNKNIKKGIVSLSIFALGVTVFFNNYNSASAQEAAPILPPEVSTESNALTLAIKSEDEESVTVALSLDKEAGQKFIGFDVVLGVEGNLEFESAQENYGDCDVSIHETNSGAISILCLQDSGKEIDDSGDLAMMTFAKNGTGRVRILSADFGGVTVDAASSNTVEVRKNSFISREAPLETATNLLRLAIPVALALLILFIFVVNFKVAQRNRTLQLSLGIFVGVIGLSTAVYLLTDGRNLGLGSSADDTDVLISSIVDNALVPSSPAGVGSEFDMNSDNKVDLIDYKLFLDSYSKFRLESVIDNPRADLVKDNNLDVRDYKRFVDGYLESRLGNS